MDTHDFEVDNQLIVSARIRAETLLHGLESSPQQPLEIATDRAAAAVERHCTQLIDEFVSPPALDSEPHVTKVRQCYTELALEFAKSVRDLEPDSERRHAIAQAIQYKILESERRFRGVMEALAAPAAGPGPLHPDQ